MKATENRRRVIRQSVTDATRAANNENIGAFGQIQIKKSRAMQAKTNEAARKSHLHPQLKPRGGQAPAFCADWRLNCE